LSTLLFRLFTKKEIVVNPYLFQKCKLQAFHPSFIQITRKGDEKVKTNQKAAVFQPSIFPTNFVHPLFPYLSRQKKMKIEIIPVIHLILASKLFIFFSKNEKKYQNFKV